ncbi:ABC transporter ATP-binding protein [Nocardioides carbamazepini]|uniref:ABC transporter ATP-binding protein n=1 Tax=Nocardioides carbamazepini TaxID=2854259 RepID=UPI00214A526A|nr:ABC transporter ATP-binding protein [Nocardioides carbamazepini]MCR1781285.1 ABC transporter ATP-binding protein [Nocardioides carbamazepini]
MNPILNLERVTVEFVRQRAVGRPRQVLHAVNEVDLEIAPGEAVGLVGESGSGKSTVARAITGLNPVTSGAIGVDGNSVLRAKGKDLRMLRRRFQMVFQDPYSSLDPSMSIGSTLTESLTVHGLERGPAAVERAADMLLAVGLRSADLAKYPHEFSGGQRQRIAIARALMTDPDLIILDEAVSALDVSTRAQVLDLLQGLRRDRRLAYLFIGHDLAVVQRMSDRIAVMYLGRIVEVGPADDVIRNPQHPYTASLLASVPQVGSRGAERAAELRRRLHVRADPPDPWNPPSGCAFATRCPFVMEMCRAETPPAVEIASEAVSRCHLATDAGRGTESEARWDRAREFLAMPSPAS